MTTHDTARQHDDEGLRHGKIALLVAFGLFVVWRLWCWHNTVLLEDHDSVSYLGDVLAWRSMEPGRIAGIGPDSNPLFPVASALLSLPGWGVELSTRLASFLFSCATFAALAALGSRFATPLAVAAGGCLLAFQPALVPMSISVQSEPTYIATVYIALWWFLRQHANPTPATGVIAGVLGSLAFLSRTEGLLLVGMVPAFQLVHLLVVRERRYDLRRFASWLLAFTLGFAMLSSLQIWSVSIKMDQTAINGREVWQSLLQRPEGGSYDEKIYGLDYSPEMVNLRFLQSHPDQAARLSGSVGPRQFAGLILRNFYQLYQDKLGRLIGPIVFLFVGIGLLEMYRRDRRYEALVLSAFVAGSLTGPLLHSVPLPHIAVIAPALFLLAGIGITVSARAVVRRHPRVPLSVAAAVLAAVPLAIWAWPLASAVLAPQRTNEEYDPAALARVVEPLVRAHGGTAEDPPRIATRKDYLAYFAGGEAISLPYTDLPGLVRYLALNDVEFLFLERALIEEFPFVREFDAAPPAAFEPIYVTEDARGRRLELYRFSP